MNLTYLEHMGLKHILAMADRKLGKLHSEIFFLLVCGGHLSHFSSHIPRPYSHTESQPQVISL